MLFYSLIFSQKNYFGVDFLLNKSFPGQKTPIAVQNPLMISEKYYFWKNQSGFNSYLFYTRKYNERWFFTTGIGISLRRAKVYTDRKTIEDYYLSPVWPDPTVSSQYNNMYLEIPLKISWRPYNKWYIEPYIKYLILNYRFGNYNTYFGNNYKHFTKEMMFGRHYFFRGVAIKYEVNKKFNVCSSLEYNFYKRSLTQYIITFGINYCMIYW